MRDTNNTLQPNDPFLIELISTQEVGVSWIGTLYATKVALVKAARPFTAYAS